MSIMFWPSVFLILGLLLLILEVFIPSGGFIGICSIALPGPLLWYAFAQSLGLGVMFMVIDLVALPLTAGLAFSLWSHTPLGRGFSSSPRRPRRSRSRTPIIISRVWSARLGRTLTPLRPCGHVEIDGQRADALAEEGFLPAAVTVRSCGFDPGRSWCGECRTALDALREEPSRTIDHSGP